MPKKKERKKNKINNTTNGGKEERRKGECGEKNRPFGAGGGKVMGRKKRQEPMEACGLRNNTEERTNHPRGGKLSFPSTNQSP